MAISDFSRYDFSQHFPTESVVDSSSQAHVSEEPLETSTPSPNDKANSSSLEKLAMASMDATRRQQQVLQSIGKKMNEGGIKDVKEAQVKLGAFSKSLDVVLKVEDAASRHMNVYMTATEALRGIKSENVREMVMKEVVGRCNEVIQQEINKAQNVLDDFSKISNELKEDYKGVLNPSTQGGASSALLNSRTQKDLFETKLGRESSRETGKPIQYENLKHELVKNTTVLYNIMTYFKEDGVVLDDTVKTQVDKLRVNAEKELGYPLNIDNRDLKKKS